MHRWNNRNKSINTALFSFDSDTLFSFASQFLSDSISIPTIFPLPILSSSLFFIFHPLFKLAVPSSLPFLNIPYICPVSFLFMSFVLSINKNELYKFLSLRALYRNHVTCKLSSKTKNGDRFSQWNKDGKARQKISSDISNWYHIQTYIYVHNFSMPGRVLRKWAATHTSYLWYLNIHYIWKHTYIRSC